MIKVRTILCAGAAIILSSCSANLPYNGIIQTNKETISGNPSRGELVAAKNIGQTICQVVVTCAPKNVAVTSYDCYSNIKSTDNMAVPLGATNGSFKNFGDLIGANLTGAISGNAGATATCSGDLLAQPCSSASVQNLYPSSKPNYSNAAGLLSPSCVNIFAPPMSPTPPPAKTYGFSVSITVANPSLKESAYSLSVTNSSSSSTTIVSISAAADASLPYQGVFECLTVSTGTTVLVPGPNCNFKALANFVSLKSAGGVSPGGTITGTGTLAYANRLTNGKVFVTFSDKTVISGVLTPNGNAWVLSR